MYEAVKIALDPTPRQEEKLWQHAGASRFAFNACLEHVKEEWDKGNTVNTSQAGLRRWFNSAKEEIAPWWRECSKEAFSHGTECLSNHRPPSRLTVIRVTFVTSFIRLATFSNVCISPIFGSFRR